MSVNRLFNIKIPIKPVSSINSVFVLQIIFSWIPTMPVSLTIFSWPLNKSFSLSWQFLSVNRHSKLFYKQGQFQNEFHCEKCEYKSSSKTLLNNHKTYQHKNEKEISHIEDKTSTRDQIENETETKIRKRFTCEVCTFKSTNENSLKMHINTNHTQENKKRNQS